MSPVDLILTVLLVVALPGYMLARSIAQRNRPPSSDRARRYQRTITTATLPSLAVAAVWIAQGRPAAWLGLGAPDRTAWILIMVALVLIAGLALAAPRAKRPANPARNAAAEAMMPVGPRETAWFLVFALAVGAGWELLYRGYLLWALAPWLGTVGAVLVMGLSYGAAHGYRGAGAFVASMVSALLFAAAFALTHSLWWLIIVHIGLPLVGLRVRRSATP